MAHDSDRAVVNGQLVKLHNSSEEMFDRCPYHFKCRMMLELPNLPSPPADAGTAVHTIIGNQINDLWQNKHYGDPDKLEEFLRHELLDAPDETVEDVRGLTDYWQRTYRFDYESIIGVEVPLALDMDTGEALPYDYQELPEHKGKVGFRGKIDLMLLIQEEGEPTLWLPDWKTGWKPPTEKALSSDGQLMRYALLALAKYPYVKRVKLTLEYLRLRRTYTVVFEADDLREKTLPHLREARDRIQRAIDEDDFPATPGDQCVFCDYECPHKGTPAQPLAPKTPEEAKLLAEQIVAMESGIATREFYLASYLNQTVGRLEAGGRFWSTESTENEEYEWERVTAEAAKLGIPIEQLKREPTDGQLFKFVDGLPELQKALGPPRVTYGKPGFSGRKRKPKTWEPEEADG